MVGFHDATRLAILSYLIFLLAGRVYNCRSLPTQIDKDKIREDNLSPDPIQTRVTAAAAADPTE